MINTVVFRICGNEQIGKPVKDCMEKQTRLAREQMDVLKAEIEKMRAREAQEGVKKPRELAYWSNMLSDARARHGSFVALTGTRKKLLQIYALLCLGVDTAYKRLSAINRGYKYENS